MERTPQSIFIASVPMIICTTTSIVIAVCCLLEVVAASYTVMQTSQIFMTCIRFICTTVGLRCGKGLNVSIGFGVVRSRQGGCWRAVP